jgi:hypothetical protein
MTWKREKRNLRDPDRGLRKALERAKSFGIDAVEALKIIDEQARNASARDGWRASELAMTLASNRTLVATVFDLDASELDRRVAKVILEGEMADPLPDSSARRL